MQTEFALQFFCIIANCGHILPLEEEYVDKAGIRVIVGHYRGDTSPHVNFSKAELDKNRSVVKDKPT